METTWRTAHAPAGRRHARRARGSLPRLHAGRVLPRSPAHRDVRAALRAGAEPAAPPRVLLHHAVVRDGLVSFTDRSHGAPQTAAVQPINIELHDVTTLRDRRGPYAVSATVEGGGVVSWDGQVSLVPVASTGR